MAGFDYGSFAFDQDGKAIESETFTYSIYTFTLGWQRLNLTIDPPGDDKIEMCINRGVLDFDIAVNYRPSFLCVNVEPFDEVETRGVVGVVYLYPDRRENFQAMCFGAYCKSGTMAAADNDALRELARMVDELRLSWLETAVSRYIAWQSHPPLRWP